jgi:hypothetical protein
MIGKPWATTWEQFPTRQFPGPSGWRHRCETATARPSGLASLLPAPFCDRRIAACEGCSQSRQFEAEMSSNRANGL